MFPIAVLIVPMYQILLATCGLIDTYLGLILVYCTTAVPYCAWMLKGYFDTIPFEIDEAGRVDGLTPFGTFWRLILPLAKPGPRGHRLLQLPHRLGRGRLRLARSC